jgi:hypothetical protein
MSSRNWTTLRARDATSGSGLDRLARSMRRASFERTKRSAMILEALFYETVSHGSLYKAKGYLERTLY